MKAEIGIFGGSGFYKFLDKVKEVEVKTPYGKPSDKIALAEYEGKKIAFLPRHAHDYSIPPHMINYRANMWAFKKLGVRRIISPRAAGSLQPGIKPGDFVVCDQFVDRTTGRKDTFFDDKVVFVSPAEPFCPSLRKLAIDSAKKLKIPVHEKGTIVCTTGPRFTSKAESRYYSKNGWNVINMSQYPEVVLAREAEICYCSIALVTDYDAGLEGHPEIEAVEAQKFMKFFEANIGKVKKLLLELIPKIDTERVCSCNTALKDASF